MIKNMAKFHCPSCEFELNILEDEFEINILDNEYAPAKLYGNYEVIGCRSCGWEYSCHTPTKVFKGSSFRENGTYIGKQNKYGNQIVAKFHCRSCKKDEFEIKILDNDDEVICCRNCGWVYYTGDRGLR